MALLTEERKSDEDYNQEELKYVIQMIYTPSSILEVQILLCDCK